LSESEESPTEFTLQIPPELEQGAYANFLGVWHTAYEFTLDFAVTQPAEQTEEGAVNVPCNVVARIKIPVGVVFDVIRTLNENMTRYEQRFGEIQRPAEEGEEEE
jgi:hypothetical protein